METKINIAELLKDCPKGMELDCTMYENVTFEEVVSTIDCDGNEDVNIILLTHYNDGTDDAITLTNYGTYTYNETAKCVIFPKGKTTWEGFVPPCKFKDGDVVSDEQGNIAIYKQIHKSFHEPHIDFYCGLYQYKLFILKNTEYQNWGKIKYIKFATKEEKERLFKAIKDNGYKWNPETKTLEKLQKFKVGDVIQSIDSYKVKITEVNIEDECYGYESMLAKVIGSIMFSKQDEWELVPSKFDITTLIPFESRVLVRHNRDSKWCGSFFSHIDEDFHSHCYKFVTTAGKSYPMCIPYNEDTKHLIGTANDCDDFYKTWEQ